MNEKNESGDRDELAEPTDANDGARSESPDVERVESPAAEEPAAPAEASRTSRLPAWMTKRGLIATGVAAALFVGGGGVGYAVGSSGHHGDRDFPSRFDRNGGPGQLPNGQFPGGGQGPNLQQDQSQGQSSQSGSRV